MSFMRRLFGGAPSSPASDATGVPATAASRTAAEADEASRTSALLREDAERLSDDLLARQLRYADRSWTPPVQGGPRRSDESERGPADGS